MDDAANIAYINRAVVVDISQKQVYPGSRTSLDIIKRQQGISNGEFSISVHIAF